MNVVADSLGAAGWVAIIVAVFAGISSTTATIIGALNHKQLQTGNAATIGQHVESIKEQMTALASALPAQANPTLPGPTIQPDPPKPGDGESGGGSA